MGLWQLFQAALLILNSVAILNEDRFLAKYGWSYHEVAASGGSHTVKGQALGLIHAVSYFRMPLTIVNSLVIFVKLLFG